MSGEVELSLVLPVYNEVEILSVLWRELAEVLPGLAGPAEVRSMMGTRRITETELRTVVSQGDDTFLRAFGAPGETA